MREKIFFRSCLLVAFLSMTSSCTIEKTYEPWWDEDPSPAAEVKSVDDEITTVQNTEINSAELLDESSFNKRVPPLNSLLVCRDKQCAPAELSMSREYIFNSLAHLVDNNLDAKALLCEANPQAHVCINPYITVPAKVGVTPAYVFFDGVKIIDASLVKGSTALNLVLGYNSSYNGQTPTVCKPDTAMLYVKNNNSVVLNGNGFKCDMTSMGTTNIRIMFAVDYIDLDYGYIGGYYSIGLSGPANGGGSGYGLIRLPKDAHPLSPVLSAKSEASESFAANPSSAVASAQKAPSATTDTATQSAGNDKQGCTENCSSQSVAGAPAVVSGQTVDSEPAVEVYPNVQPQSRAVKPVEIRYQNETVQSAPVSDINYSSVQSQQIEQPAPQDLRSQRQFTNSSSQGRQVLSPEEAQYEEVYIDDLDDYVK